MDPVLGQYLEGKINGGVYTPGHLALMSYVLQNPLKYRDPQGKFEDLVPWMKEDYERPSREDVAKVDEAIKQTGEKWMEKPTPAKVADVANIGMAGKSIIAKTGAVASGYKGLAWGTGVKHQAKTAQTLQVGAGGAQVGKVVGQSEGSVPGSQAGTWREAVFDVMPFGGTFKAGIQSAQEMEKTGFSNLRDYSEADIEALLTVY
jgi:hypothetical protein